MKTSDKKAILILDIQDDFTKTNGRYPVDERQAAEMIHNLNNLLAGLKENYATVVYIGNEFSRLNPLNLFRNFAAIKGSKGTKIDDRLNVVSINYFAKRWDNSFTNPDLDKFLKQLEISEIFIAGVKAEACVKATAKGALKRGYKTTVLVDCIATSSDAKRTRLIETYKNIGIQVLTSDSLN